MRRIAAATALLLCHGAAQGQVVYQCVGSNGRTEYSSWPCKAGQVTRQAIPAAPDPVRPYVPPPPAPVRHHRPIRQASVPTQAQRERDARAMACRQAKREREATLARVGLRRTFDLLRRLDDEVRLACGA